MFAEASLFAERYHCDAIADQPTALLAFKKTRVLKALASDSMKALHWIEHLSKQVQMLRAQAMLLSLNAAEDRVPQLFAHPMHGRFGDDHRPTLEGDRERAWSDPRGSLSDTCQAGKMWRDQTRSGSIDGGT